MAQYTKHNSNYIKTNIHQKLKDGSTIFERDWVTVGSQLHFGPGKIPMVISYLQQVPYPIIKKDIKMVLLLDYGLMMMLKMQQM